MTKRQEAKRAELAAAAEAKGYMTVADLGAYLKTFPQDGYVSRKISCKRSLEMSILYFLFAM